MSTDLPEVAARPAASSKRGLLDRPYPAMLILTALITQVVGAVLLTGVSVANLAFALPIMLPAILLCALALARGKPWMYLGAGATLVLLPVLILAFAPAYATTPQLGPLFAGAVLALLSIALGLPTGLWVFRNRSESRPIWTLRQGLLTRQGVFTVLLAGMCLGAIFTGEAAYLAATRSGAAPTADFAPEASLTVTAANYLFSPANLSIPVGRLVEVTVVNQDPDFHTFTYTVAKGTPQERTYNHDLLPSSTSRFLLLITSPVDIRFWCIPHEAMGMVGNLHVS